MGLEKAINPDIDWQFVKIMAPYLQNAGNPQPFKRH